MEEKYLHMKYIIKLIELKDLRYYVLKYYTLAAEDILTLAEE